jgi:hypothetical protein
MRSILTLFVIAALGFLFILQKNDDPQPTTAKTTHVGQSQVNEHNFMKHALDKSRVVAQNVSKQREGN